MPQKTFVANGKIVIALHCIKQLNIKESLEEREETKQHALSLFYRRRSSTVSYPLILLVISWVGLVCMFITPESKGFKVYQLPQDHIAQKGRAKIKTSGCSLPESVISVVAAADCLPCMLLFFSLDISLDFSRQPVGYLLDWVSCLQGVS